MLDRFNTCFFLVQNVQKWPAFNGRWFDLILGSGYLAPLILALPSSDSTLSQFSQSVRKKRKRGDRSRFSIGFCTLALARARPCKRSWLYIYSWARAAVFVPFADLPGSTSAKCFPPSFPSSVLPNQIHASLLRE